MENGTVASRGVQAFSILDSQLFRAVVAFGLMLAAGSARADDNPTLVGKPAPNFTLRDMSGQTVSLDQFRGRPVVLAFWSTRCAPCCAEAVHLTAFQKKYAGQGLVVLGIDAWNAPTKEVQHFVKSKNISHRILLEGERVARKQYKLGPIPTTYWIDKSGTIVHQAFGFNEKELKKMEGWIKRIIGGTATADSRR
jgi:peroxiredoxin